MTPGLVLYISPLRQGIKPHAGHSCCLVWLEASPSQVIYLFVEFWCVVLNITRIERYNYVTTHTHFLLVHVPHLAHNICQAYTGRLKYSCGSCHSFSPLLWTTKYLFFYKKNYMTKLIFRLFPIISISQKFCSIFFLGLEKIKKKKKVICYHNCSNVLWEKKLLVWGKNLRNKIANWRP